MQEGVLPLIGGLVYQVAHTEGWIEGWPERYGWSRWRRRDPRVRPYQGTLTRSYRFAETRFQEGLRCHKASPYIGGVACLRDVYWVRESEVPSFKKFSQE